MPSITLVNASGTSRVVTDVTEFRSLTAHYGWLPQFGSVDNALATLTATTTDPNLTGTVKTGAVVYSNGSPVSPGSPVTADAGQIVRWARAGLVDVSSDPLATALAGLDDGDAAFVASATVPSGGAWPAPALRPVSFTPGAGTTTLTADGRIRVSRTGRNYLTLFARSDGAGVTGSAWLAVSGMPFQLTGTPLSQTLPGASVTLTGSATLAQADANLPMLANDSLFFWTGGNSLRVGANVDMWLVIEAQA